MLFVAPVKPSLRKLPHMTWFGHCIVNVTTPLQASPSAGQLKLISDLRHFLNSQEQEIRACLAREHILDCRSCAGERRVVTCLRRVTGSRWRM